MARAGLSRFASRLLPPWFLVEPPISEEDPLVEEFRGPWSKVYVTERWVYVSSTGSGWKTPIRLEEVAAVRAGIDPSPHDEGPLWGIWMTSRSGFELEATIVRAPAARRLIQERAAARASRSG